MLAPIKSTSVCTLKCSETGHKYDTCNMEYKCVNWGEKHASYNKKCSFYLKKSMIFNISEYQRMF